MSKKRFIQGVLIRSLPALDKVPEAVSYAEGLWEALSQHGYGESRVAQRNLPFRLSQNRT